jgi:tetratricopeptide (TPR) repeat protein
LGTALMVALPGAITLYTAFEAGGFFAGTPALLAVVAGIALVGRITLAQRPFEGIGRGLGVATAALGLYCVLVLASASWSDAPALAMIEFDRALLYWLLLVLLGSLPRDDGRVAWALRGVTLAFVAVCGVALLTRLFPDLIDVPVDVAERRLSYPLTYWNTLALMAALGLVLCLHHTASEREPIAVRLIAAGALPVLATTLYLTFSRGGLAVALVGVAVYAIVARPRSLPGALLTVGPAVAVALMAAYDADLLAEDDPTSAAAAAQGSDLATVVALCVIAAVALRALAVPLDERLRSIPIAAATRRTAGLAAVAGAVLVAMVAVVAFDAVGFAQDRVEGFTEERSDSADDSRDDLRGRLTDPGNNGRIKQWTVALDSFEDAPWIGHGAGRFTALWAERRETDLKAEDAHSLYLETLAELGLVGALLLGTALAAILGAFALRARGESRHLYAALLAAGAVWALHAGVDWDWEMPAATMWLFALGGMALAIRPEAREADEPRGGEGPGQFARVAMGVACLAVLATPALVALSQGQIDRSVAAFKEGDCGAASEAALDAAKLVSARPQPYQILGYCNSRAGESELAISMFETAVARDRRDWQSYYGLALVRAAAGRDPRPAAREALRLNPREALARDGVRRFRTADPQKWKRRASDARLPIL